MSKKKSVVKTAVVKIEIEYTFDGNLEDKEIINFANKTNTILFANMIFLFFIDFLNSLMQVLNFHQNVL